MSATYIYKVFATFQVLAEEIRKQKNDKQSQLSQYLIKLMHDYHTALTLTPLDAQTINALDSVELNG